MENKRKLKSFFIFFNIFNTSFSIFLYFFIIYFFVSYVTQYLKNSVLNISEILLFLLFIFLLSLLVRIIKLFLDCLLARVFYEYFFINTISLKSSITAIFRSFHSIVFFNYVGFRANNYRHMFKLITNKDLRKKFLKGELTVDGVILPLILYSSFLDNENINNIPLENVYEYILNKYDLIVKREIILLEINERESIFFSLFNPISLPIYITFFILGFEITNSILIIFVWAYIGILLGYLLHFKRTFEVSYIYNLTVASFLKDSREEMNLLFDKTKNLLFYKYKNPLKEHYFRYSRMCFVSIFIVALIIFRLIDNGYISMEKFPFIILPIIFTLVFLMSKFSNYGINLELFKYLSDDDGRREFYNLSSNSNKSESENPHPPIVGLFLFKMVYTLTLIGYIPFVNILIAPINIFLSLILLFINFLFSPDRRSVGYIFIPLLGSIFLVAIFFNILIAYFLRKHMKKIINLPINYSK